MKFALRQPVEAAQWNAESKLARALGKINPVRATTYLEVHNLVGTSGCSYDKEMYDWSVLGILETAQGKLIVRPGDWIIEDELGNPRVCRKEDFDKLYVLYGTQEYVDLKAKQKQDQCNHEFIGVGIRGPGVAGGRPSRMFRCAHCNLQQQEEIKFK